MVDSGRIRLRIDAGDKRFIAREYTADGRAFKAWLLDQWPVISKNLLTSEFRDAVPPAEEQYTFWMLLQDGSEREFERQRPLEDQIDGESEVRIQVRKRRLWGRVELRYVSDTGQDGMLLDVEMTRPLGAQVRDHVAIILAEHTFRKLRRKWYRLMDGDGRHIRQQLTPEQLGFDEHTVVHLKPIEIGGIPPTVREFVVLAILAISIVSTLIWFFMPRPNVSVHVVWNGETPARIGVLVPGEAQTWEAEPNGQTDKEFVVRADRLSDGILIAEISPQFAPLFRDTLRVGYKERREGSCEWQIAGSDTGWDQIQLSVAVHFVNDGEDAPAPDYVLLLNGYAWEQIEGRESIYHGPAPVPRGLYRIECVHSETSAPFEASYPASSKFPDDVFRIREELFDILCPDRNDVKIHLYFSADAAE